MTETEEMHPAILVAWMVWLIGAVVVVGGPVVFIIGQAVT